MSVFNEKDIVIHNGKVGIITEVNVDCEEVTIKFDGNISLSLPYDCVTVVDRQTGQLDHEGDYWLFTQNNLGIIYKVHVRKTSLSICDDIEDRTYGVGEQIQLLVQDTWYKITPQDHVFLNMLEFFEGHWFESEKFAEIEEVCNWISCVENFVDVEIVWYKCQPIVYVDTDTISETQEENLREEYYQACSERRNNFWRE